MACISPFYLQPLAFFYAGVVFEEHKEPGFVVCFLQVLFTLTISSSIFGFMSFLPVKIVSPDLMGAFFFARMLDNIRNDLQNSRNWLLPWSGVPETTVLHHVMFAMAVYSSLVGLVIFVASLLRLSFIVQFLPYQVGAGFISGGAMLAVRASINLASGQTTLLSLVTMLLRLAGWAETSEETHDSWLSLVQGLLCFLWGLMLMEAKRLTKYHFAVIPIAILVSCAIFYLVAGLAFLLGASGDTGDADSGFQSLVEPWMVSDLTSRSKLKLRVMGELGALWGDVFSLSVRLPVIFSAANVREFLSMMVVLTLNWTFQMLGAIKDTKLGSVIDQEQEVKAVGMMNLVGGVLGGVASCHHHALNVLAVQLGVTKLGHVLTVLLNLALVLFAPSLISIVPRFIIGGVLCCIASEGVREWTIRSRQRVARTEWLTLLVIALVMLFVDLALAVIAGLLLSLAFCAMEYNDVTGVVAQSCVGSEWSHVERPSSHRKFLIQRGGEAQIFWLEGYLFFGSASTVLKTLRAQLEEHPAQYVILDLARVPAVDASGVYALADFADSLDAQLALCGMVRRLRIAMSNAATKESPNEVPRYWVFADLDAALEWAEEELLSTLFDQFPYETVIQAPPSSPLTGANAKVKGKIRKALLAEFGHSQDDLCCVIEACGQLLTELWEGMQICHEGSEASHIFFLVQGAVSTLLRLPEAHMKHMDSAHSRHLNLAKGDHFVDDGFRQRKFVDRAAIGVVEFAVGLKEYLVSAEVAEEGTAILQVPREDMKNLLEPQEGMRPLDISQEAREALLRWQNARLVDWIMAENAKVRKLVSLSRTSRGNLC